MKPAWLTAIALAILLSTPARAAEDDLATKILRELIAINTAPSGGNDLRPAVDLVAGYLEAAGFGNDDIVMVAPEENVPNLVVRYRSSAPRRQPILMMAHLDVVDAVPKEWSVPPFELTEIDGYYYGRGTNDNKAGADFGSLYRNSFLNLINEIGRCQEIESSWKPRTVFAIFSLKIRVFR